jgi:hypothetical protein
MGIPYLLYATLTEAQNGLNFINNSGKFPATNGKTTEWHPSPDETLSGKFGFPLIPQERLDAEGIEQEFVDDYFSNYPPESIAEIGVGDLVGGIPEE